ncbi:MAG: amino acid adenylation domain-containing protein [Ardenticatenaceae bacterium]|nr:amino acid adenylation domain-containing protein [Ardenticatenaceae bacterium]
MTTVPGISRENSDMVVPLSPKAYWQAQLVGDWPTLTFLMKDVPQQQLTDFAAASFTLKSETVSALDAFQQKYGLTHSSSLLAAYAVLLARYAVQEEMIVGVPWSAVEETANILPIRVSLNDNPPFLAFVQQVQQRVEAGIQHSDVAVAEILVQEGHPPLQVQFSMGQTADFGALSLYFQEIDGRLQGSFRYATELFTTARIDQLTTHFQQLLHNGLMAPETAVQNIPMLTAAERHQLLVQWNDRLIANYQPTNFVSHFQQRVQEDPTRLAVISDFGQLTYQQLNEQANQLARYLRQRGAGAGKIIAISMERVPQLLVAMMGVQKSGEAYIPIDPTYPLERQQFMLEDGDVLAILTQEKLLSQIPTAAAEIICLDRDWPLIAQQGKTDLALDISPDDTAYIIYTSGSTGKPKGVLIPHKGLVNFTQQAGQYLGLTKEDRCLQFSSISFDSSVVEIYCAFMSGATLALRTEAMLEVDEFLRKLAEWQLTALACPTAFWHELALNLTDHQKALPASVRVIIFGGEKILPDRIKSWQAAFGHYPRLVNGYGPTEFTVGGTFSEVSSYGWENGVLRTHIGRPLTNQQAYVLSDYLEPVPVGVPGELYLGGIQVAKGYLNRPDLTAERFLNNPFYDGPEARLYKTGDLVQYWPDGNLEFMGRADYQVKFRGYRIELGEIEEALNQHTAVQQSVVLLHTNQANAQRLIAYCVAPHTTPDELTTHLAATLPEYMLPSNYTFLEAFPMTPGGKINRRALPEPIFDRQDAAATYVAPRTDLEAQLAQIWADSLGIERVGVQDNFFELGGHSLLAVRMLGRAKKAAGHTVALDLFFQKPTIAALAHHFTAVSPPDTLTAVEADINLSAIPRLERDRPYYTPSSNQQGIWLHEQVNADIALYNVPLELRLVGSLETAVFAQAWQQLVERHESLRTVLPAVDGRVRQQLTTAAIPLDIQDISDLDETAQAERLQVLRQTLWQHPFDVEHGPLVAALLVRLGPDSHHCLINTHHSIADGWSAPIMLHELGELYTALRQNRPAQLPELTVQYIDYAAWEQDTIGGDYAAALLAYWRKALAGMPSTVDFPTDLPRPARQTFVGKTHFFTTPTELAEHLRQFSQKEQATLYMTMLSAMQTMVYRYSGQPDFGIGSPYAGIGRSFPETESLIGCFINLLVLRAQFTDGLSSRELLAQTKERVLAAGRHQALAFDKLVEALQPSRLNVNPFFQMAFVFEGGRIGSAHYADLEISPVPAATATAKYDLSFYVNEVDGALQIGIEYNTALFLPDTIERMAGHYTTLLSSMVAQPDEDVAKLPMLTAQEREQLLRVWNETAVATYPHTRCVHHLFEEQAEKSPNAIAVVSGEHTLTYRQLNERANQVAHYLQRHNVQPNQFIGLCLPRNINILVGLLGILKAGAAYLPLDPDYPDERLAFMLQDTQAGLILTQEQLKKHLPPSQAHVICLDTDWEAISKESTKKPTSRVQPHNLAYIIHTSGSTGKPKGVQIPHQAVVNFLWTMKEQPGLTSEDVLLAVTTLSFDIAVLELFLPIVVGARVVIVGRDMTMDAPRLAQAITSHQATVMQATPATWNMLVSSGWQGDKGLKILSGGEAISRQLANDLLDRVGELWNMYGPTETTIWSTIWPIPPGDESILIGKPIANTDVYILDKNLQPVPIGVPGELHIGGDGVSHGYLHRPNLTQERFIADPFKGNGRIYKTGDLARYRADGSIECLGRLDFQVKVRGFRIELGEIESVLLEHQAIEQAVVTAREDGSGGKRLVAYLIAGEVGEIATNEIRAYLSEILPPYMVPSQIVWVSEYPLTPNGKVNRRALPEPAFEQLESSVAYVAPRTDLEAQLAAIWATVLELEQIGVHDNFFELGGHSLLAVSLMNQIQKNLGHRLTLAVLFQTPTIAELAAYLVVDVPGKKEWHALVEIQPGNPTRPPFFCVHGAGGNVLNFHDLAHHLGADQPVYGLQAVGVDGLSEPLPSVEAMADLYLSEIRERQSSGPYYVGGYSGGGVVAYEMAQRLYAEGEDVLLVFFDTFHPHFTARSIERTEHQEALKEEGLSYLIGRAIGKFERHYMWYKQKFLVRYYLWRKRPLPFDLRDWYLTTNFSQVVPQYQPQPYSGKVVMFRATAVAQVYSHGGLDWGWRKEIANLEIVKVPGTHDSLILEPNVKMIVGYLKQLFKAASMLMWIAFV